MDQNAMTSDSKTCDVQSNDNVTKIDGEKKQQPSCDVDSADAKNDVKLRDAVVKNGNAVGRGKSSKMDRMSSHPNVVKYSRIFKKVSPDGNLVLFLPQREIMVTETKVEPLMGVALIHQGSMLYKHFAATPLLILPRF